MHTPGLKVVCPSNPYDAKGLLLAAIRDDDPVIFLEHKRLYGAKGGRAEHTLVDVTLEVPEEEYEVPLGSLAIRREGADVTIVAHRVMTHYALGAAERLNQEGIGAEVIDIRCLVPLDLDVIMNSVKKTTRLLIVEEDNLTGGWGAEIAARVGEQGFYVLDKPITRIAAPDTPLPCSPVLEKLYVPSVNQIVQRVEDLVLR
jgi:pyruvate dehydrogenase E1 component beta subunit